MPNRQLRLAEAADDALELLLAQETERSQSDYQPLQSISEGCPTQNIRGSVTTEELCATLDRAWLKSTNAWAAYHAAVRRDDPLELTNILCANAWETEHLWRRLYDAASRRESPS
jgi:hypothetical protein